MILLFSRPRADRLLRSSHCDFSVEPKAPTACVVWTPPLLSPVLDVHLPSFRCQKRLWSCRDFSHKPREGPRRCLRSADSRDPAALERARSKTSSASSPVGAAVFILVPSAFGSPFPPLGQSKQTGFIPNIQGKNPFCWDSSPSAHPRRLPQRLSSRRRAGSSQQLPKPTASSTPTARYWQLPSLSLHLNIFFIINTGEFVSEITCALHARRLYGFHAPGC